jgi:hypothetical protein
MMFGIRTLTARGEAMTPDGSDDEAALRRVAGRRRLTLLAMCIAQGMILLDVTIVNVALPSIQRELHESPGELEWNQASPPVPPRS